MLIDIFAYDIKTIVSTTQERIDWYFNEFKTQPDKKFGKCAGKKWLCEIYLANIQREDAFFSADIFNGEKHLQRWNDFLEDCIIFACLHSYLNKIPMLLVEDQRLVSALSFLSDTGKINSADSPVH